MRGSLELKLLVHSFEIRPSPQLRLQYSRFFCVSAIGELSLGTGRNSVQPSAFAAVYF